MVGLFACLIVPSAFGQNTSSVVPSGNSADARPDLWVVTLNAQRVGDYKVGINRTSVINALGSQGAGIRPQDSVIIMHAGLNGKAINGDFLPSFIRQLTKPMTLHQIRVSNNLLDNAGQTTLRYPYLARTFSLYALKQSGFDFSPYRNICHILINDRDGVPNKSNDLAAIRRLGSDKYEECIRILNVMESDSLSAKGDGIFFPLTGPTSVSTGSRVPAYTTFSRYSTYEDLASDTQENIDLLEISKFEKGLITITLKDTNVSFLRVNSVVVNGIRVMGAFNVSGNTLNITDSRIKHSHHNQDTVEVAGIFIRYYNDQILGRRGRVMELSSTISMISDMPSATPSETVSDENGWSSAVEPHVLPILCFIILVAVLVLMAILITNHFSKTVVRIIYRDKDYQISRRAFRKLDISDSQLLGTYEPTYHAMQLVDDILFTYLDRGITVRTLEGRKPRFPYNVYLITDRSVDVLNGNFRKYVGVRQIWGQAFREDIPMARKWKLIGKKVYVFDWINTAEAISFRIDGRAFCVEAGRPKVSPKEDVTMQEEPFLKKNKQMLSGHWGNYTNKSTFIANKTTRNNILINQLLYNNKIYWVLNIYDLNYGNRPDCLYLRYVLVVDDSADVMKDLLHTARWVLRSEGEKMGGWKCERKISPHDQFTDGSCEIISPPITCYLFLRSDKRAQLVYSPFQHDELRNIEVDLPEEPFELMQFALFDKAINYWGTNNSYYSGCSGQTLLKLGITGSNRVECFLEETINKVFAYGIIHNHEPRICKLGQIKHIIGK